jgi:hypothetical protein
MIQSTPEPRSAALAAIAIALMAMLCIRQQNRQSAAHFVIEHKEARADPLGVARAPLTLQPRLRHHHNRLRSFC